MKSTNINKIHSPRDSITLLVTTFEQTKQIIMDKDTLSHSITLHNRTIQSLNLKGLCQYDNSDKAHFSEYSSKPINCSYMLVFLKHSACYTVTPDTHQWYKINTNKITDNHNTAICNDTTINMVPLPPAEPHDLNTFETIVRMSLTKSKGPTL